MSLTIFDRYGNPKAEVSPNDSSTQSMEIQSDNVLSLSFTHYDNILLDVDDYVDFGEERYWLCEKYRPKQKSIREWEYNLKLYGAESLLRNILVVKRVDNENNPVFTLTAPPREHVDMIVNCMNDGMGHITDWKVGQVDGTENIVIDYFGKYCDEALREIAGKVGAEYWIEGQTMNVCRCEHGEPLILGYDNGLTGIEPDRADNVKFYTRLYPVGSSRNIDSEKYGYSRLQLPDGKKYVEINADKYSRVDHYEESAFADIYPRRIGIVSSVRSELKTGEDGNPFTIYYFKDDSLSFDPNNYEIAGLVKRVSFQEGSELAGLGADEDGTYYFEVNYNSDTREFEIITVWPYDDDTQLPGGKLVPKAGDKYILWHLRMPDEYYRLAEEEFLTAVEKYNKEHALDITVFKASTDHVWIEDNQADLYVGRRVKLLSEEYFPGKGYRDSRITKITRNVNLPSLMDIEIGDALSRSSKQKFTDDIADARNYAQSIGASISLPDIIRTGDRTAPTDNNLFSARRSKKEFLSRIADDVAQGHITFEEGLTAVGLALFKDGAHFGEFVSSLYAGKGAGIDKDGNGEFESVRVRGYLEAMEYIVNRLAAIEGDQLLTEGDTIDSVVDNGDGTYGLYLHSKWDGYFTAQAENNVIKGIINSLASGSGTYYTSWMRVNSVNPALNYIEVTMYPDDETPAGKNYPPCELMRIARWGNQTDTTRQSCLYLSSTEGRIVKLTGVTKPIIDKSNYGATFGTVPEFLLADPTLPIVPGRDYLYARGIVVQDWIQTDHFGKPLPTYVDRGPWSSTADYYCQAINPATGVYETSDVWYRGCKYRCQKTGTHNPPAWNGTDWAMIEGNPDFMVEFAETDYLFDPDNFDLTLVIIAWLHNIDITQDIADTDVVWSRYSEDAQGTPRVASDNAWALKRAGSGKSLYLTAADMDFNGYMPKTIRFSATVTLRDGMGNAASEAQATFEY